MASGSTKRAATLLFAHGAGFNQNVWAPVIKRLQKSSLIQKSSPKMVSFDFPYHGSNRDVSQPATLHLEDPERPRVSHPAMHWAQWGRKEVEKQVRALRAHEDDGEKAPLIGIAHSMGAASMWAAEAANPGMFDGLILFEPMTNVEEYGHGDKSPNFLVTVTLKRKHQWNSFEEAEAELMSTRNFAKWHPESLKSYIKGAVVKASPQNNVFDPDAKWVLSCHPHIEASLFSGPTARLTDEEMARVKCPITFNYGEKTVLFFPQFKQPLVDKFPHLYRIAPAVPNTTHTLVMEDPDTIVSRIVDALSELPPFGPASRL